MKLNKGDLIAIKTLEDQSVSAIVLSLFNKGQFIYCYVLETGIYRLAYQREVDFVITKEFDPKFIINHDIFDLDYSFYEACSDMYAYSPFFGYPFDPDDDSDEDDE